MAFKNHMNLNIWISGKKSIGNCIYLYTHIYIFIFIGTKIILFARENRQRHDVSQWKAKETITTFFRGSEKKPMHTNVNIILITFRMLLFCHFEILFKMHDKQCLRQKYTKFLLNHCFLEKIVGLFCSFNLTIEKEKWMKFSCECESKMKVTK